MKKISIDDKQSNRKKVNRKIQVQERNIPETISQWKKLYDRYVRKSVMVVLSISLIVLSLMGCGNHDTDTESSVDKTKKKIVLTTGFGKDEVFRIDRTSCKIPEVMVYLTNTQNQYESVFGKEIWQKDLNGANLESSIKENVLARIAQIKAMNLLAEKQGIVLNEDEMQRASKAAEEYENSLTDTEKTQLGVDQELLKRMYEEYALANKVYDNIIKDINPEISDDEARTITVQQILLKTYTLNGKGEKEQVSQEEKAMRELRKWSRRQKMEKIFLPLLKHTVMTKWGRIPLEKERWSKNLRRQHSTLEQMRSVILLRAAMDIISSNA